MANTKQRALILNIIKNTDGHLSADEIYILARKKMPGIALATVYNNLNALYSSGVIGKIRMGENADLFDRSPLLHGHLICDKCNKVKDVVLKDFKEEIEKNLKEEILYYDLIIKYICKDCRDTIN